MPLVQSNAKLVLIDRKATLRPMQQKKKKKKERNNLLNCTQKIHTIPGDR